MSPNKLLHISTDFKCNHKSLRVSRVTAVQSRLSHRHNDEGLALRPVGSTLVITEVLAQALADSFRDLHIEIAATDVQMERPAAREHGIGPQTSPW